jgi:hypothetical protein
MVILRIRSAKTMAQIQSLVSLKGKKINPIPELRIEYSFFSLKRYTSIPLQRFR